IQLLLMQGRPDDADREAETYLSLFPGDLNKYRLLASFYERRSFYDQAIRFYEKARQSSGQTVFALEIANAAMQSQRYERALQEYLQHMTSVTNINHYIKNQIKNIVTADSTLIGEIARFSAAHDSDIIRELYASSLVGIKDYARALEIYKVLPETYLKDFAAEQYKQKNYDIALPAYMHLAQSGTQPLQKLNYRFEVARMYYEQAMYDSSNAVLQDMVRDPYWTQSPANQRNRLNVAIRRMIAENAMAMGEDIQAVMAMMEEAKTYAVQVQEREELDLALARLQILNSEYDKAGIKLKGVNQPQNRAKRDYLYFLSAFMRNDQTLADSLMNEYMLQYPGDDYANDIIYLNMLSINMQAPQQKSFSSAISLLQKLNPAGIDSLYSIYVANKDEELLLLAIEWAIGLSDFEQARAMLNLEFRDPLAAEYASYLRLALLSDPEAELELARNFLKSKPNSIFSPGFRQVISRVANSRISL
ncbi:MAG TPA: hypothetical protein PLX77_04605, partial [Candidatus Cloacimonadota bacterium]|nr:hypothetical protein [Candidatus Cloacimonadota bacterium]